VDTLVLKVGQNFERSSNDPNTKLLYVICFDQIFSSSRRRPPATRHTQAKTYYAQDTTPPPPLAFRSTPITALIAAHRHPSFNQLN
jgi:hypothetical protein